MRIISDFRDYYDGVMGLGQNKENIWHRNTFKEVVKCRDSFLYSNSYKNNAFSFYNKGRHQQTAYKGHVYFCGRDYRFIYLYPDVSNRKFNAAEYFWDEESLRASDIGQDCLSWKYKEFDKFIKTHYNDGVDDDCTELLRKYNSPYLIRLRKSYEVVNSIKPLVDIGFPKMEDAYSCFQKLEQFKFGVLGSSTPPMIELSDEEKQIKAGFTHPYSFRKEKWKKK